MNERRPPNSPPPRLESFRPAGERGAYPPQRRPAPPPRRVPSYADDSEARSGFLPGMLYTLLGFVVLAAAAIAAIILLLPADFVRDRIVQAVKEQTGRDLVIRGQASFTVYPSVGFTLEDVTLSAAPGMASSKPLVVMRSLDARVALLPLLSREVRIETLVLREPVVHLEVDKEGRKSWSFDAVKGADAGGAIGLMPRLHAGATGAAPAAEARPDATAVRLDELKLEDVRIENGTLFYLDQRTGSRQELSAINARLGATAMAQPLTSVGSLVWKGRSVSYDAALTSVAAVMEDRPAKLNLALVSSDLEATFEGTATFRDVIEAEGILKTKSPSLRRFLAWAADVRLPPSAGFGPLSAKGLVRGNPKQVTLASAEIALDGATAYGQITLDTAGVRPLIKTNLKLDVLNLNTYAATGEAEPERSSAPPPAPREGNSGAPQSIDDLLMRDPGSPGPKVKGYTRRAGWSEEPYQTGTLALLDANAKLSVGRLLVRDLKIGQTELTVTLKDRVMQTTLDDVRLYDGRGRGFVTMDASRGARASLAANMTFEGISAESFLKDAAGIDRLSGKGRLAYTLAGKGANEREVIETLNGKLDFTFKDGAIAGINIPQMLRAASEGRIGNIATEPAAKTDFSELASTWTITAGVAQNQDLRLTSPLIRLTGEGRVMLPAREIDYLVRPRLVSDLTGQGGNQNVAGLEIPVRVTGGWNDPKFRPDFASIARDPNQAVNTVKEIGKQLKGKNAGEIVDELLGKGQGGEAAPAKKLLEQFLRP